MRKKVRSNNIQCTGKLQAPARHVATIRHDEIPGVMGAMTTGYSVKDSAEFAKLTVGESFNGTVYVQGDDLWVGNIHKGAARVKP